MSFDYKKPMQLIKNKHNRLNALAPGSDVVGVKMIEPYVEENKKDKKIKDKKINMRLYVNG